MFSVSMFRNVLTVSSLALYAIDSIRDGCKFQEKSQSYKRQGEMEYAKEYSKAAGYAVVCGTTSLIIAGYVISTMMPKKSDS